MVFSGSNLNISGILSNILSWSFNDETLSGKINIESPHFDLDKFMTPSQGKHAADSSEEPFELPDKMNIAINANIGKVNYTGKELNNLNGNMHLKDQRISLINFLQMGWEVN